MNLKALLQERADLVAEQKRMFAGITAGASTTLGADFTKRDDEIVARISQIDADVSRIKRQQALEMSAPGVTVSGGQAAAEQWQVLQAEVLKVDKTRRGSARTRVVGKTKAALATDVAAISGGDERAAERPFASFAENLQAAVTLHTSHQTSTAYRQYVANVQQMYAASGLNEQVGSEGGVLVMTDYAAGVLKPLHEEGPFSSLVRNIPVSSDANGLVLNAIDETSRATGSRWGGMRGYRLAEAGALTATKPAFRRMELKLKKYGVAAYSTDELLKDSSALEEILTQGAGEELSFMVNDDILNGAGTTGPLGILNAGALISVAKEVGQAAATVVNANLIKMWQRLHPRYRKNAIWAINSEVEPQLDVLSIPAGVGALEPRYVNYGPDGLLRIKGRPVVVSEFNAALGTLGDIVLFDPTDYVTIDKGGVQFATSIHVQFLADEQVFRFLYRIDGQPTLNAAITPYKGANTQSAYVGLATRA